MTPRRKLRPEGEPTVSRASVFAAVMLSICLPLSTTRARISCPPPDKSGLNGEIHSVLVTDGSPVHKAGQLRVHASNWGAIGSMPSAGMSYSNAPSAEWPKGSGVEYLFVAGLWVGALVNGVPAVSTSAYQMEFRPSADPRDTVYRSRFDVEHGARIPANPDDDNDGVANEDPLDGFDNDHDGAVDEDYAAASDQMLSRHFRDDQPGTNELYPDHKPLHLDVHEDSYSFADSLYNDFVGFSFTITNTGTDTLRDVYVGLLADGDVGNRATPNYWDDDAAGTVIVPVDGPNGSVTYAFPSWYDANGDGGTASGRCGFVLLDHTVDPTGLTAPTTVSWHSSLVFQGVAAFADGGDPTNDAERYEAMASGETSAPKFGDIRSLMSVGPFPSVAPGKTITFTVALVVADGFYWNVEYAVQAYNGLWFDLDHDPATGIDGKEHQEHWYLPDDDPVPVWFSGFSVGPDGGAVRLRWGLVTDQPIDHLVVQRAPANGGAAETLATLPGTARDYLDLAPKAGEKYAYRVVAFGKYGSSFSTPTLTMTAPMLPTKLWLSYPNPFRDQTTISAHLAAPSSMNLAVFDVAGRRVARLASGTRRAGEHIFTWNGTDETGRRVPAGVYFCRMQVGDQVFREKLVLVH